MSFTRMTVVPARMGGVPCIRGLPIPVATVVGMRGDGMTEDEILAAYPDLEREDLREALRFAAEAVRERELPLVALPSDLWRSGIEAGANAGRRAGGGGRGHRGVAGGRRGRSLGRRDRRRRWRGPRPARRNGGPGPARVGPGSRPDRRAGALPLQPLPPPGAPGRGPGGRQLAPLPDQRARSPGALGGRCRRSVRPPLEDRGGVPAHQAALGAQLPLVGGRQRDRLAGLGDLAARRGAGRSDRRRSRGTRPAARRAVDRNGLPRALPFYGRLSAGGGQRPGRLPRRADRFGGRPSSRRTLGRMVGGLPGPRRANACAERRQRDSDR